MNLRKAEWIEKFGEESWLEHSKKVMEYQKQYKANRSEQQRRANNKCSRESYQRKQGGMSLRGKKKMERGQLKWYGTNEWKHLSNHDIFYWESDKKGAKFKDGFRPLKASNSYCHWSHDNKCGMFIFYFTHELFEPRQKHRKTLGRLLKTMLSDFLLDDRMIAVMNDSSGACELQIYLLLRELPSEERMIPIYQAMKEEFDRLTVEDKEI